MFKVKEILNANSYDDVEFYRPMDEQHFNSCDLHGDTLWGSEPITNDEDVLEWQIMDEEDYNNTILANSGDDESFAELFGDEDAKILVIVLHEHPRFYSYDDGWYFEFDHMGRGGVLYYGAKFTLGDEELIDDNVALTYSEIMELDC